MKHINTNEDYFKVIFDNRSNSWRRIKWRGRKRKSSVYDLVHDKLKADYEDVSPVSDVVLINPGKIPWDISLLNKKLPNLRSISIDKCARNLKQLSNFKSLVQICIAMPIHEEEILSLSEVPNLRSLVIYAEKPSAKNKQNISFTKHENLRHLRLFRSHFVDENFDIGLIFPTLESLELIYEPLADLELVKNCRKLKLLEISYLSRLENICAIKYLSESLRKINIEVCKNINNFEVISKFEKMEEITIMDSSDIQSLEFIRENKNLRRLNFSKTNICDGSISFLKQLKNLEDVVFLNKRHYDARWQDFCDEKQEETGFM